LNSDLQLFLEEKVILNEINGSFRGCELTGIVGPSGSGKSSVLNILSGFVNNNVSGSILINGQERNVEMFKKQSTYIMQEENLHSNLTIREAMRFAIKFKTGNSMNEEQKNEKIMAVLATLGLEKKLNFYTGKLSGGERKRLSIAVELVDDPTILFLDEPTTGLDSLSSTHCIQLMRNLAREGKTIVCTIHTPSAIIFEMFDHIYAMAEGSCIYQGSVENLVPFLKELNLVCPEIYSPCDFLLEIATNDYGNQNHRLIKKMNNGLNCLYRNSENNNNIESSNLCLNADEGYKSTSEIRPYKSSFASQLVQLLYRNFLFLLRDKYFFLIRFFIHLSVGLTIGLLYYNIGNEASQILNIYRFVTTTIGFLAYSGFYSLMLRCRLYLEIAVW
jgi:ATP-binding cassette, subfamily G (WHITE), member 1